MYVESVSKLRNTTGASVGTLADENCDWDTVSRLCLQSPARLNCTTESQLTSKPVHVTVLQYYNTALFGECEETDIQVDLVEFYCE